MPESDRLQEANSFKDTAKVLRMTMAVVACQAVDFPRIARFVADADSIHSYGGTKVINSLLVYHVITGSSVFVS